MGKFQDAVITTGDKWTVKQFCDRADQGLIKFDNVIQRNLVWNIKQKSLFIHSLILNYLPPECLANKKDGIYDMADGKQRNHAASSFIHNKFKLTNVPDIKDDEGNEYILNGKYFKDLRPDLQEIILSRPLPISIMDNASQDVVKEYFFRRNNGTPLTAARKAFAQAKSFDKIAELSDHPLFRIMFLDKAKGGDNSKGVVQRSYAILFCENKSMESKKISQYVKSTEFTDENVKAISEYYDILLNIYESLRDESKVTKRAMKKAIKQTHTTTLLPIVEYVVKNNIDIDILKNWIAYFFSAIEGATVNKVYNENVTKGTSKLGAVTARLDAMQNDLEEFIKNHKD